MEIFFSLRLGKSADHVFLFSVLGIIKNGVNLGYEHPRLISNDFNDFLMHLLDDTKAWIRGDKNWKYMDDSLYTCK